MKKKIFLTLGALAMCVGLTVCIPNTVLAASKDAVINTVKNLHIMCLTVRCTGAGSIFKMLGDILMTMALW